MLMNQQWSIASPVSPGLCAPVIAPECSSTQIRSIAAPLPNARQTNRIVEAISGELYVKC